MTDAQSQFKDSEQVANNMKRMYAHFKGSEDIAGMGVIATLTDAIAKLADEIEELKNQKE